jgi:hypothetical protein
MTEAASVGFQTVLARLPDFGSHSLCGAVRVARTVTARPGRAGESRSKRDSVRAFEAPDRRRHVRAARQRARRQLPSLRTEPIRLLLNRGGPVVLEARVRPPRSPRRPRLSRRRTHERRGRASRRATNQEHNQADERTRQFFHAHLRGELLRGASRRDQRHFVFGSPSAGDHLRWRASASDRVRLFRSGSRAGILARALGTAPR